MAHVADNLPPHSIVPMPPHAWSTEQHRHSNSTSNRLSLPVYPTTSPVIPQQSWNSSHQDSNTYQLHPTPPSSDLPSTDPTDHLNADTIFRDLLNLRIAHDSSPDTTPSLQHHLTLHNNPMPTQVAPHPSLLHQDLFAFSDPDPDHLDIPDQYDHTEQPLKHFPSHLTSLPFLQHHIHHHTPLDPSLSDSLSLTHRPPFPSSHPPYPPTHPITRRHSSQGPLLHSSSVSDQTARSSSLSRSHPTSLPSHPGPRIKNDLYKTELCRSFAENAGFCKYGSKCQFAHGEEELRPVRRHPRYKTKLCRNFVNNGSCPYDTRCRFIHANDLPFVSVPTLSGLHQSSTSTAPPSDAPDQARYDPNNTTSEEYTDHLRRILSMTPGSSAASVSASAETHSVPFSSPHASPPAETESGQSSLNTSKKNSNHVVYSGQAGNQTTHITPADHVYHARADVFRNYPDSAFSQPYAPLVPASSESALTSTAGDDVITNAVGCSLREARVVDGGDLNNVFHTAGEVPVSQTFRSKLKTTSTPKEKISHHCPPNETLNLQGDGTVKEPVTNSTPAKGSRGRLPVFLNITSDRDSV